MSENQPINANDLTPAGRVWLWVKRTWRRVENIIFAIALFFILLYFLLQTAFVQNYLITKITNYLSEDLHTEVKIKHIDFSLFDNLVLDGFYVADLKGDTLLYASSLKASLNSNIFTLLQRRLEFNEITLTHAQFHLAQLKGEKEHNLQFIIDYFSSPSSGKPKRPFVMKITKLELDDVVISKIDEIKGQNLFFNIPTATFKIDKLDIPSKIAEIASADLDGLSVQIKEYTGTPLPPENPAVHKISVKSDTILNAAPRKAFVFTLKSLEIDRAAFSLDKIEIPHSDLPGIDYKHLNVRDINLLFENISGNDSLDFSGRISRFEAKEQSGIGIKSARAEHAVVSNTLTGLYGLKLNLGNSTLGDTLELRYDRYPDFRKFETNVRLNAKIDRGSQICLGDIMFFAKKLQDNPFFKKNSAKITDISGNLLGPVNDLKVRDLNLTLEKTLKIEGKLDGYSLSEGRDKARLWMRLDKAESDIRVLREILPGFNPPAQFDKLGYFNFKGSYNLEFGVNHILDGVISTGVGYGEVDMELDMANGKDKAAYSGSIDMTEFDLGKWTGNAQLGKSAFKLDIQDGSTGLNLATINTHVTGTVRSFAFRDYVYQNIEMNGHFDRKQFTGKLKVNDPNLNFNFNGLLNFTDSIPVYSFSADVNTVNLKSLHLQDQDLSISLQAPSIELKGRTLKDIVGSAVVRKINIKKDGKAAYFIDSLAFISGNTAHGDRQLSLKSEIGSGYLTGNFDLENLGLQFRKIISRDFPVFAQKLNIYTADTTGMTEVYNLNFTIFNSKNIAALLVPGLDTIRGLNVLGRLEASSGNTHLEINAPRIKFNNFVANKIDFRLFTDNKSKQYELSIDEPILPGNRSLAPILLTGGLQKDALTFHMVANNMKSVLKNLNLSGAISPIDSTWQVKFDPSDFTLFNDKWYMDEDNYLRFGKNFITVRNFDLMNGNKRITLDTLGNGKGLYLSTSNFDLSFLDNLVTFKNLTYKGNIYDLDVSVRNIFKMEGIQINLTTDTVFIKNHPYGEITGYVEMETLHDPVQWQFYFRDTTNRLRIVGAFMPKTGESRNIGDLGLVKPGEFQSTIDANGFPLNVLEKIIGGISKTTGGFDATARIGGPPSKYTLDGVVTIPDAALQIDYLKAMFYIRKQRLTITENQISVPNGKIWDGSTLNSATVSGTLNHNRFKDWDLHIDIDSDNDKFMVLNTQKSDNPLYYGQGIGKFFARFTGSFKQTDIHIDCTTGDQTRLFIPISSSTAANNKNFIQFVSKDTLKSQTTGSQGFRLGEVRGLNIDMNLTLTQNAEVQLIFDEQAGDIVKGRGEGDLNIQVNRTGDFKMYGNYAIRRGEYTFTLLNWVNKPFTVLDGGTITWFGDPLKAQIDLDASYNENTPIYNLIQGEIEGIFEGNEVLKAESQKPTIVNLLMHLKGDLFKPNISFDLNFPNITSELKSLVDNKIRVLRQDQNELNRQVFGLVVVGSFLPSGSGQFFQSSDYLASAFNTLTQVLTNQFSNYLSTLAAEWFGGAVSSIDFDIAYNDYRDAINNPGGVNPIGRELQVRMSSGFANDRITIHFGSQFGLSKAGVSTRDGFLGEDVTVEIQLTENRHWKLKIYQRTEPDIAGGQRRSRYGAGITFNKDFDSFRELFTKGFKEAQKAQPPQ